jgi:membrane-associated phospholipid phosphatase
VTSCLPARPPMRSRSCTPTRWRRADRWIAAGSGAAYLALGPLAARDPRRWERRLFQTANTGGSFPLLRVPQQLGTPWLLPSLSVLGWATNRPHLMMSGAAALPVEKALELGVKKVVARRRPAQVMDAELHDDAPVAEPSYPSGHAAIATCGLVLGAPYLPGAALVPLTSSAAVTAYTRVHQGAHFPLDALGGALLGLCVGSMLNAVIGVPARGR